VKKWQDELFLAQPASPCHADGDRRVLKENGLMISLIRILALGEFDDIHSGIDRTFQVTGFVINDLRRNTANI